MTFIEVKYYIEKFCGKMNEDTEFAIVMQLYLMNKQTEETVFLGSLTSYSLIPQIKVINNGILLDINYKNPFEEEYKDFIEYMDVFNQLLKEKDIEIINTISIIKNPSISDDQLIFLNPKFNAKCAHNAGRPITGYRLLYDFNSIIYGQNDISEYETIANGEFDDEDNEQ